jgi:hypothetical protein
MKFIARLIKAPHFWVGLIILAATGLYACAEITAQPWLDPLAADNQLPERYERVRIGMSRWQVLWILGAPNQAVGQKIGPAGLAGWPSERRWADQQHILKIVVSNPDERVLSRELFHIATDSVIAHEP